MAKQDTPWSLPHWTAADAAAVSACLLSLSDEGYRAFNSRLVATSAPMHGVRMPQIKALAKQIVRGNWREFLALFSPAAYEEILLRGLVIGHAEGALEEILAYTAAFVPLIDNWAVNDSFVSSLKIAGRHREAVWQFLQGYLSSEREFELRFGVTMLLSYYLTPEYIGRVLSVCGSIRHEGYYVKMAVAWALSACYVKFPEETLSLLREGRLDDFTHNKTIQKCLESYQVTDKDKAMLRAMKREGPSGSPTHSKGGRK